MKKKRKKFYMYIMYMIVTDYFTNFVSLVVYVLLG